MKKLTDTSMKISDRINLKSSNLEVENSLHYLKVQSKKTKVDARIKTASLR